MENHDFEFKPIEVELKASQLYMQAFDDYNRGLMTESDLRAIAHAFKDFVRIYKSGKYDLNDILDYETYTEFFE